MAGEISMRNVVRFDGQNFQQWKFTMRTAFRAHDLLKFVEGTEMRPADISTAAGRAWLQEDAKAMFLISSAIEPPQMESLLTCDTSKEMWDKLSMIHEQKTASHKFLLSQRFHDYRMDMADSVMQHVSKVQNLARQLADLGERLPDTQIMAKIIVTLPTKFHNFRTTWSSIEASRQNIGFLVERLVEEEELMKASDDDQNIALIASSRRNKPSESDQNKQRGASKIFERARKPLKDITCYVCGEKGHVARMCVLRKQESSQQTSYEDCALIAMQTSELNSAQGARVQNNCMVWQPTAKQINDLMEIDQEDVWIADSGASAHITFRSEWLTDYKPITHGNTITLGDGTELAIAGKGTVLVERLLDGKWKAARLDDVLLVPEMGKNLYSIGVCTSRGLDVLYKGDAVRIKRDESTVAVGWKQQNQLHRLFLRVTSGKKIEANVVAASMKTWHERLGHLNTRALKDITGKGVVSGVKMNNVQDFTCAGCKFGKAHRLPFNPEVQRHTVPGEMIHSDVCGPMPIESLKGARFFVVFKDDATCYRKVFFIKHKADVLDCFKVFEREIQNRFGRTMKILRSDNGTEYKNKGLSNYLQSLGIVHEFTAPYTPEQNGKAE
ncbi:hypothetical protein TKK_0018211 [Trichogramma kaykai]|uniref:Retrovirus-related Pol polyprotein from transposon TNT 1-94 n=1 Tax=Trichogramma kaykai TaxID=54128 RepID=A0ABD2VZ79_9HYME